LSQRMLTADFDFELPPGLIAQQPAEPRDRARLLVLERAFGRTTHHVFADLKTLLRPGDLLVANKSRVLPARVRGQLMGGGRAEILLLRHLAPARWEALVRPGRRLRGGSTVGITENLRVHVVGVGEHGVREIEVETARGDDADAALLAAGSMPLPPYIRQWSGDPGRYQTVYAEVDGSAAAPTAGLHFTTALLDRLQEAGVGLAWVVLHVGLDTFRPVQDADPAHHPMHRERFSLPAETIDAVVRTRASGGRVVAVGTTSVRTLETWASTGQTDGWTDLFIRPGFAFRAVDAMITNFHLPRSTLLMLVSAFAGRELVLATYRQAVEQGYRFFSFGDAMLIT
jgi:S-adenosylmethionine:tRNA ribosyltransferase-isomerase